MEERVMNILEFDKIIDKLSGYAESSLGKNKVRTLTPSDDINEIEIWQEETENAINLILKYGNPPLFGIYEVKSAAHHAKLGGCLSAGQILQIGEGLRVSKALQVYVENDDASVLTGEIRSLYVNDGLEKEISNAIISAEEISDTASHKLFSIRRSMVAKQDQVKIKLNQIMADAAKNGYLRENIITMRQGRYVLPVKAESRRGVNGVVHDQSGSGATIFIEPLAIVNLNNEITQLEIEEKAEIQRILLELSGEIAEFADEIANNQSHLQHLDFSFAKAKYALEIHGSRPIFNEDRIIDITNARHPLLGKNVVPINIRLGEEFNTLVITGPNTGGKTVTLKTLGLLTIMAQSGMQIPATEKSKLGIFSSIYADIGDKQSIEMSLSTFSASMTNIVSIINSATDSSLVLFDELGAGTDPTEGAALAMAILEYMTDYDIRTVATTHYSELKLFAMREDRVQNASVEFDVETLSPTYHLIIGIPGRSNAFEISKRLGLQNDIIEAAGKRVDSESIQFEDVLSEIEKNRIKAESERQELAKIRKDYEERLKKMATELKRAEELHKRQMEEAKDEAYKIVSEAKDFAQSIIRQAKQAEKANTKELDRAMTEIHDKAALENKKYERTKKRTVNKNAPKELQAGESVRILSMNQEGVIVKAPDKNGDVLVQMGIIKVNSNVKDLIKVENHEEEQRNTSVQGILNVRKTQDFSMELDLRGKRYDEAMGMVDKYLDDAVLSKFPKVRIIHGKGTGALRKGITELLKKDSRVLKFGLADIKEGGAGVTVVELK